MTELIFKSTMDVKYIDHMGNDRRIVEAMLVSTNGLSAEDAAQGSLEGRIKYLMKNRHGTPFECSSLTALVHAPIKVWREFHRHRVGWCLSGDTPIDFVVPCNGDRKQRKISDLFRRFHTPNQKSRIGRMSLRCVGIDGRTVDRTQVVNVMSSGVKRTFRLTAGGESITASVDHDFLTRDGWKRMGDFGSGDVLLGIRRVGDSNSRCVVEPSFPEEWRVVTSNDNYEVSSHGRVRSYLGQGSKRRRSDPILKKITVNKVGRAVVGIDGSALQVSRLVAEAFFGELSPGIQILHYDDDPSNNCLDNLRAGTPKDNSDDQIRNGRRVCNRVIEMPVQSVIYEGEEMTYDIGVPHPDHNFVANGFIVHNSYNEESGRYKQLDPIFYIPPPDRPMIRPDHFKSSKPDFGIATSEEYAEITACLRKGYRIAYEEYESMLALGADRGLARDVLGVGIYSACYVTCNPRSLMHFLELRTRVDTAKRPSRPLWEINQVANQLEMILKEYWPITYAAWHEFGRCAP